MVLIDDYAHHPTEINAVANSVREMYPNEKVLVVFQPHLFSRTRDFAAGFADSLSRFDQVLLLDIYPAREDAIEGVTSKWLLGMISSKRKKVVSKSELKIEIEKSNCKIKLLVGAGDIGVEVDKVTKYVRDER